MNSLLNFESFTKNPLYFAASFVFTHSLAYKMGTMNVFKRRECNRCHGRGWYLDNQAIDKYGALGADAITCNHN